MCDEWYTHKKKKLLKEFNTGTVETQDIVVQNVPKFNLMDFISIILFIDDRIHNILVISTKKNNNNNLEFSINEAINVLNHVPLFSSKITDITLVKQNKYLHQAST